MSFTLLDPGSPHGQLRDVESRQLKLAEIWNNQGACYSQLGDLAAAQKLYRRVLDVRLKLLGDALPTATAKYNLGISLFYHDQLEEAMVLFNDALSIRMQLLGPTNPATMHVKAMVGETHLKTGRAQPALECFQVRSCSGHE